ncbi:Protein ZBED8 [Eumeta japonica]|uniref:Protein ZBED8 n=1 Tax=Eumeta variegata TaxID=151549 RepID=A0A4C1XTD5_EUMVA|nr:Protein ZBED8 [Eumeta japonica]
MRPSRLERHLSTKHSALKDKPKEFFASKSASLKRMKLDSTGSFAQSSEKVLEASYELSLLIAKAKKSQTIGETLVKPCLLKAADIVLGPESKQKFSQITLSDNSVKRRIDDTAEDIKKSDIFDSLNTLNLKLQGGDSNIIYHRDAITAYTEKLQLWKRKILASNYSCFPKLFAITEEAFFKEILDEIDTKNKISNHLQHLTDKFKRYFPDSCNNIIYRLATDPFHVDIDLLTDNKSKLWN